MEQIQKKKKWFAKWWGVLIIIFSLLIITLVVNFTLLVFRYKKAIESGDIIINTVLGQFSSYENTANIQESIVYRDELENYDSPYIGASNPMITIVIFSDFKCSYCAIFYPVIKQFTIENNNKVRLIFRNFPLDDMKPSMAARCAFDQDKFWQMHDKLFDYQEYFSDDLVYNIARDIGLNIEEFNSCYNTDKYKDEIDADLLLGIKAGVQGTPTLFINGERFRGVMSKTILEQILEALEAN